MIGWSAINPVLIAVFTDLALDPIPGARPWAAEWAERPRELVSPEYGFDLTLKVTTVAVIGRDEPRFIEFNEAAEGDPPFLVMREVMVGLRRVTLRVEVESGIDTDTESCFQVIERVRTRLGLSRVLAQLLAVEVDLLGTEASRDTSYTEAERRKARVTMDVMLGVAVNDRDPVAAGWFNRVSITSHVSDAGEPLAPSLQQVNEVIGGEPPA